MGALTVQTQYLKLRKGIYRICDTGRLDGSNVSSGGYKAINKTQLWKLRSLYFLIKFTSYLNLLLSVVKFESHQYDSTAILPHQS